MFPDQLQVTKMEKLRTFMDIKATKTLEHNSYEGQSH